MINGTGGAAAAPPVRLTEIAAGPFSPGGRFTALFRAAGVEDFDAAARHLLALPYGRIADRERFWLVLEEGRGTCSTKHALLAALAREQDIAVQLTLGIYEMSERNTPGVGRVLSAHGLASIPEAHCYLRAAGERIDVTGVPAGAERIGDFLHEEPIAVDQIGQYKIDRHRRFLRDWLVRPDAPRGVSLDELWAIREACIAALGAGAYASA